MSYKKYIIDHYLNGPIVLGVYLQVDRKGDCQCTLDSPAR